MNHTTIPVTAQGEPIPLVKLGQGREGLDAYQRGLAKECLPGDYHQGSEHESGPLETVQTFAEKLRKARYKEPVLPNMKTSACDFCGHELGSKSCLGSHTEGAMVFRSAKDEKYSTAGKIKSNVAEPLPVVSREGFRAGVLSALAGGLVIACFYLAWGIVAACLFAAVCVGFVAGMLITQEWK